MKSSTKIKEFVKRVSDYFNNQEDWFSKIGFIGLILVWAVGIFAAEYFYFTNAEKIRLLFVLLLIPLGALAGMLVLAIIILPPAILWFGRKFIHSILTIYLLYRIVLWVN
jgi:hypothetical protein